MQEERNKINILEKMQDEIKNKMQEEINILEKIKTQIKDTMLLQVESKIEIESCDALKERTQFLIKRAVDYNNKRVVFLEKVLKRTGELENEWDFQMNNKLCNENVIKKYAARKKLVSKYEEKYNYDFLVRDFSLSQYTRPATELNDTYQRFVKRTQFIIETLKKLNQHYYDTVYSFLHKKQQENQEKQEFTLVDVQNHLQDNPLEIEASSEIIGCKENMKLKCNFVMFFIKTARNMYARYDFDFHIFHDFLVFRVLPIFPFNLINSDILGDVDDSEELTVFNINPRCHHSEKTLLRRGIDKHARVLYEKTPIANEIDFLYYLVNNLNMLSETIYKHYCLEITTKFWTSTDPNSKYLPRVRELDIELENDAFIIPTNVKFGGVVMNASPEICNSKRFFNFSSKGVALMNNGKEILHMDFEKFKNVKGLEELRVANIIPNYKSMMELAKSFRQTNIHISYVGGFNNSFLMKNFLKEIEDEMQKRGANDLVAKVLLPIIVNNFPKQYHNIKLSGSHPVTVHEFCEPKYEERVSWAQIREMGEKMDNDGMMFIKAVLTIENDEAPENSAQNSAAIGDKLDIWMFLDDYIPKAD